MSMSTDPLFVALVKLTQSVHQTLCAFYENPDALDIHHKADESPVTEASEDRGGSARRHSHRDRRADRLGGARLLPSP